jgi:two-component system chemotaxis sensor kinase CheA
MENNDQILDEFLLEAQEIFDQLDLDLVQLEQTPDDKKLLGSIFRAMHTLKGSSGFFGFHRLEKVAHAGESLLSKVREGTLRIDEEKTDALLATLDRLRDIIGGIADQRQELTGDDSALIATLKALAAGESAPAPAIQATVVPVAPPAAAAAPPAAQPAAAPTAEPPAATVVAPSGAGILAASEALVSDPSPAAELAREGVKHTELAAPVKINVELLDKLMNLVSEMVLARNRLLSFATNSGDINFTSTVRTIDMITLELQERMMKTRMQPVSNVWAKFPRLVRDISNECGKKVELIQLGAETELDRTLLEGIRDPLIHIIRNSVDHGIETPEVRRAKGKKETGSITLRSMHESGMVVIEIADDGGGIDIPLVAKMAVQKGLVTAERVARMADREIIDFIYLPGFSTKAAVTTLSGRGVGMDVVRTNVQQIGGSVDIATSERGTNLRLRIPLTLAIMPAVFVQCGGQRFAIPQSNLFEMIRYEKTGTNPGLENFYGVPVFRLRNKLIPIIYLRNELGLGDADEVEQDSLNIVVVQAAALCFGLVVDKVLFMQEVVVKSVGTLLKGSTIYSGATILGDGRVAMIFDIGGIAVRSGMISKLLDKDFKADMPEPPVEDTKTQSMLLFDLHSVKRIAIPLDYVDRLEMFAVSRVERRGNHSVIIYGDQIMKLIWLSDFVEGAGSADAHPTDAINVIVHYHNGQPLGFVVKVIHDIVAISSEIILISPPQPGIMGSSILGDSVVSILNVQEILQLNQLSQAAEKLNSSAALDYEDARMLETAK